MKLLARVFCAAAIVFCVSSQLSAQRATRVADRVYPLTLEEAKERWNEFLNGASQGGYCFKVELEHRPRKGESVYYDAIMWSLNRGDSLSTRLLVSERANPEKKVGFLILSENKKGQIYRHENGKTEKLSERDWQKPLMEGLIYTPFDVLMPYKYWNCEYAGPGRAGRALHFFDLSAPADFAAQAPDFALVRVGLSREFNAPFLTQYFNKDRGLLRSLTLASVKKFQENWVSKQIEMTEEKSRDKDKITLLEGAFAPINNSIFEVKNLDKPADIPALEKI